jgi:hypothetical protein
VTTAHIEINIINPKNFRQKEMLYQQIPLFLQTAMPKMSPSGEVIIDIVQDTICRRKRRKIS